jgi:hypothetical protein
MMNIRIWEGLSSTTIGLGGGGVVTRETRQKGFITVRKVGRYDEQILEELRRRHTELCYDLDLISKTLCPIDSKPLSEVEKIEIRRGIELLYRRKRKSAEWVENYIRKNIVLHDPTLGHDEDSCGNLIWELLYWNEAPQGKEYMKWLWFKYSPNHSAWNLQNHDLDLSLDEARKRYSTLDDISWLKSSRDDIPWLEIKKNQLDCKRKKNIEYDVPEGILIIDVEASGLHDGSYPTEIAWMDPVNDERATSFLIKPSNEWLNDKWDTKAESITGITRQIIVGKGLPLWEVAELAHKAIIEAKVVLSDEPKRDTNWILTLFEAVGSDFSIPSITDYHEFMWRTFDTGVVLKGKSKHRAGGDVERLAVAYYEVINNGPVFEMANVNPKNIDSKFSEKIRWHFSGYYNPPRVKVFDKNKTLNNCNYAVLSFKFKKKQVVVKSEGDIGSIKRSDINKSIKILYKNREFILDFNMHGETVYMCQDEMEDELKRHVGDKVDGYEVIWK